MVIRLRFTQIRTPAICSRFNSMSPPIAVLRLDADWYASTMICLQKFWDHILPNGIVLIDDYYYWDGCALAVHDFLSQRKIANRIRQGPVGGVAYIQKEAPKVAR